MGKLNIRVVPRGGLKLKHLLATNTDPLTYEPSVDLSTEGIVYKIPCKGCNAAYYGESFRSGGRRRGEHVSDWQTMDYNNKLVKHCADCNHSPDFENYKIEFKEKNIHMRKLLETWSTMADPNHLNLSSREYCIRAWQSLL